MALHYTYNIENIVSSEKSRSTVGELSHAVRASTTVFTFKNVPLASIDANDVLYVGSEAVKVTGVSLYTVDRPLETYSHPVGTVVYGSLVGSLRSPMTASSTILSFIEDPSYELSSGAMYYIDDEVVVIVSGANSRYTVTRGSTPSAHLVGSSVYDYVIGELSVVLDKDGTRVEILVSSSLVYGTGSILYIGDETLSVVRAVGREYVVTRGNIYSGGDVIYADVIGELGESCSNSGTSLIFMSAPEPALNIDDVLYIDTEAVTVESGSGTDYVITRGSLSSTASIHYAGVSIYGVKIGVFSSAGLNRRSRTFALESTSSIPLFVGDSIYTSKERLDITPSYVVERGHLSTRAANHVAGTVVAYGDSLYPDYLDSGSIARVRQHTGDTNIANDGADCLFSDEEIQVIINDEEGVSGLSGNNLIMSSCAHMYEIIAGNTALYVGKQSFLNNFVDGPSVSVELNKIANEWRSRIAYVL